MWSGSGSERTRSITGLNFKGGPSVAPNLADWGIKGLRKKGGRFKAGGGRWPYYAPNPLRGGAAKGLGIKGLRRNSPRSCGIPHGREIFNWGLRIGGEKTRKAEDGN